MFAGTDPLAGAFPVPWRTAPLRAPVGLDLRLVSAEDSDASSFTSAKRRRRNEDCGKAELAENGQGIQGNRCCTIFFLRAVYPSVNVSKSVINPEKASEASVGIVRD